MKDKALQLLNFLDLTSNGQLDFHTITLIVVLVKMSMASTFDWGAVCMLLGSLMAHQMRHMGDKEMEK